MVHEHHFRFAEHLIFEEPVFTVPVLLHEKRHYFLDEELYFYYQSPHSTMRSNWNDRRMDFVKVWLVLVKDLEERGLLQKYYDEIGYLFFREAYTGSILMLTCKRFTLKIEEMNFMINSVLELFPDILENPYLIKEENAFRAYFRDILTLEITEEVVQVINNVLMEWVKRSEGGK